MAYDPGAIETTLATALGDDPALIAELRQAFTAGVRDAAGRMAVAQDDADWRLTAERLKGLAASFGAVRLVALAGEAARGGIDAAMLARIDRMIARL